MPSSEDKSLIAHQQPHDQPQPQYKVCTSCQSALVDSNAAVFPPELDAPVCTGCREHGFSQRLTPTPSDARRFTVDVGPNFSPSIPHEEPVSHDARRKPDNLTFGDAIVIDSVSEMGQHCQNKSSPPSTYRSSPPTLLTICCDDSDFSDLPLQTTHASSHTPPAAVSRRQSNLIPSPDPLTDITRIRIRSQGHHCLYPGATFQGTQKSGRNSYDVNVTIVVGLPCPLFFFIIASENVAERRFSFLLSMRLSANPRSNG